MPPKKTSDAVEEQKELLDAIEPDKSHKTWTIGPEGMKHTFTQKPLSYFAKMEFYALLADAIDKAMISDDGFNVAALMGQSGGVVSFDDPDSFLKVIVKLVRFVPDLFEEAYCIFLAVPRGDRFMIKEMMRAPVDEGGLSDDDGLMIVQTFLDQNLDAIEEFFTGRVPKLGKRVRSMSKVMSQGTK